ncbi:MAG: hypothetical protein A2140_08820 [Candidatus Muproteobacteria bacterium RBG_16_62_13]|uniref:Ribosomal protein L7/L12 C-terminal domain-containing protein n=1 Tax=Candidatus Muproteobacteria bacterium RBG_16_62_13 TaxID=1817756 RepID=A0A1F6T3P5_9PROT|nr:MAG: hypothetical protein A2140_08820 [Candidatus Muproteobacteria bacterium RBG_16_62_13]
MADPGDARLLPDDVVAALRQGNKIAAIRRLREAWKIGLKEAKDHIDAQVAADPALRQKLQSASRSGVRGCLFWLILFLFIGYSAYQLLSGR